MLKGRYICSYTGMHGSLAPPPLNRHQLLRDCHKFQRDSLVFGNREETLGLAEEWWRHGVSCQMNVQSFDYWPAITKTAAAAHVLCGTKLKSSVVGSCNFGILQHICTVCVQTISKLFAIFSCPLKSFSSNY